MRHMLVVDDEPEICAVMRCGLEEAGNWRTTAALSLDEASAILSGDRPDAAIVDAVLRDGSGLALASPVAGLGIPVLIMTGHPDTQQLLQAVSCPYRAKPFRLNDLLSRMQALLDDTARQVHRLQALKEELAAKEAALADGIAVSRNMVQASREDRARREGQQSPG
jgi:DNA-binding NtrC family response regulator